MFFRLFLRPQLKLNILNFLVFVPNISAKENPEPTKALTAYHYPLPVTAYPHNMRFSPTQKLAGPKKMYYPLATPLISGKTLCYKLQLMLLKLDFRLYQLKLMHKISLIIMLKVNASRFIRLRIRKRSLFKYIHFPLHNCDCACKLQNQPSTQLIP